MKKKYIDLNKEYSIRVKVTDYIFAFILFCIFSICGEFFYRQTVLYNGYYVSDSVLYVEVAKIRSGVRAISWIFHKLYNINESTFEIALFMSVVIVGIIIVNYLIITYVLKQDSIIAARWWRQLFSIIALFSGPIYMIIVHEYFYRQSWSKFAWHSPTQQLMTLFGLITILLFLKVYENYINRINVAMWIGVMISALASAWAKPSFMLVFTPVILIFFILDLFKKDKYSFIYKFKRIFLLGSSMLPAGIYILYLNNRMFVQDSTNEVAVQFGYFLMRSESILFVIIFSLAFPIVVFCFNVKIFKKTPYKLALGIFIMGLVEALTFIEEGSRMEHGNFIWGRMFGTYLLFLIAIIIAMKNYKDIDFLCSKPKIRICYFIIIGITLILHMVSQLWYFYLICKGVGYEI